MKPQLKTLGPKYGKKLGAISAFLATCDGSKVVEEVRANGSFVLPTDAEVVLSEEDLQIFTESKAGFISASDKGVTVALNTTLTEALIVEGIERELVSKIQTMRKEAGFEITDRICVAYQASGKVADVLKAASFKEDVLAVCVSEGVGEGYQKEVDINGEKIVLCLALSKKQ